MARRGKTKRTPAHYVIRDRHGRFKEWTSIPRGIKVDSQWDAKKKLPRSRPGYGHQADYPKAPAKGFYTDKSGKVRPITSGKGVSRKSLRKAKEGQKVLSKPRKRSAKLKDADIHRVKKTEESGEHKPETLKGETLNGSIERGRVREIEA